MDPTTPAPTPAKITTIAAANIILTIAKAAAGFAVGHGYIQSSGTEAFAGFVVLALTYGWSFWTDYGQAIAKASLDILRAKILDAAAKANQGAATPAPAALASLAAHVVATAPPEATTPAAVRATLTTLTK